MRLILFFDLPTETIKDKKYYRDFRKFLIKEGFIMMQFSVYSKLVLNGTMANIIREKVYSNKPPKGTVQLLMITEKQFQSIEYIVGVSNSETIDSDEGVIFL